MGKTLLFDCSSGAAGDMLLAAILDVLIAQPRGEGFFRQWMESVEGLLRSEKGGRFEFTEVVRGDLSAKKIEFFAGDVPADHHVHARSSAAILGLFEHELRAGRLNQPTFELAARILRILQQAEAAVHGAAPETVHFHEVGAFDSIMDIAGFASAFTLLAPSSVISTAVTPGSGKVKTAHGLLDVPPPAVREIVRTFGIPFSARNLPGECLTPTGAAILAAVVDEWTDESRLSGETALRGAGAGTRDIPGAANIVEAFLK